VVTLAEIDAVYRRMTREVPMWRVILRGNPAVPAEPIIELLELPAVVRHNLRTLETGAIVVDTYVINVADPMTQRAVADFMAVDVLEGGRAEIEKTGYGYNVKTGAVDEPAR
jgi:hypothetical protein